MSQPDQSKKIAGVLQALVNFRLNNDKLSIEGIKSFLLGVLGMNVLNTIDSEFLMDSQFQEIQQVEQVQEFLHKCLVQDSPKAEFMQSLGDLACYKNESIPTILENLHSVSQFLSNFVDIEKSINVQFTELESFIRINIPSDLNTLSDRKKAIRVKYLQAYMFQLLDTMIERSVFMNTFIADYWDYIPGKAQELIIKFVNSSSPSLDSVEFASNVPELKLKLESCILAFNSLKSTLSLDFIQRSSLLPKIFVPDFGLNTSTTLKTNPNSSFKYTHAIVNKGYTLDTILERVAPYEHKSENEGN